MTAPAKQILAGKKRPEAIQFACVALYKSVIHPFKSLEVGYRQYLYVSLRLIIHCIEVRVL